MSTRNYAHDVAGQNAYRWHIEKETDAQLKFYLKYRRGLNDAQIQEENGRRLEVMRKKLLQQCPLSSQAEYFNQKGEWKPKDFRLKKWGFTNAVVPGADKLMDCTSPMFPVSPNVRNLISQGHSAEGKGRYRYLRERCKLNPDEKYVHPLQSSWDYGWQLSSIIKPYDLKKPKFGYASQIAHDFYSPNGIHWSRIPRSMNRWNTLFS